MAWDMSFLELGSFIGNGFNQIFGNVFLLGMFLILVIFWWTRSFKAVVSSMVLMVALGFVMLSKAGYLPVWTSFVVLIVVATFAGMVVMSWLS